MAIFRLSLSVSQFTLYHIVWVCERRCTRVIVMNYIDCHGKSKYLSEHYENILIRCENGGRVDLCYVIPFTMSRWRRQTVCVSGFFSQNSEMCFIVFGANFFASYRRGMTKPHLCCGCHRQYLSLVEVVASKTAATELCYANKKGNCVSDGSVDDDDVDGMDWWCGDAPLAERTDKHIIWQSVMHT